MMAKQK